MYNSILEKILLPLGDAALGTSFIRELKRWRGISMLNEDDLRILQRSNLSRLLEYAVKEIPYYRGLKGKDISDPFELLKEFPILTKSEIKQNIEDLVHGDKRNLVKEVSSGSTGVQGTVYMSKHEQSISRAIQTLWWEWAGYRLGNRFFQTGMTTHRGMVKRIKDVILRTRYTPAFDLHDGYIADRLNPLHSTEDYMLGGYASSLYTISQVAKERDINDIKFKSAISWGDKLFPHYRRSIESVFKTKVFDTYGCTEGLMIAAQKDLDHMYIMSPHVVIEIVDEYGKEVPDGQVGHVLVTRLDGNSMPLIRYRVGDLAIKLPEDEYPENRELNFPLLKQVIGRETDIVRTKSGKYLIVHFFTGIFEHFPQIKQFRVVQSNLDGIVIEYIPDRDFATGLLTKIRQKITDHLQEEFEVLFKEVERIHPTPSGKPQLIELRLSTPATPE